MKMCHNNFSLLKFQNILLFCNKHTVYSHCFAEYEYVQLLSENWKPLVPFQEPSAWRPGQSCSHF